MTFIDWSDPEEMLGLLAEYVADARIESEADPAREALLAALLNDLTELTRLSDAVSLNETTDRLRRIHERNVWLSRDAAPGAVQGRVGSIVAARRPNRA